jgi:hypothetical protein
MVVVVIVIRSRVKDGGQREQVGRQKSEVWDFVER